ncbi:MAG: SufD family Fe-S cluster assembly protein [Desulfurococcales archaeon]|nr:SufD family Fe-S cluster assembly protein [Desulfurococcales archaeon]
MKTNGDAGGTILYQAIKDSPTVKYYTDWKQFEKKLDKPKATMYDLIKIKDTPDLNCIVDTARKTVLKGPKTCIMESSIHEPMGTRYNSEALFHIHQERTQGESIEIVMQGGKFLVLIPGGNGYTGYNLRIRAENGESDLYIVDTGIEDGIKTIYKEIQVSENAKLNLYELSIHRKQPVYSYTLAVLSRNAELSLRYSGQAGKMTRSRTDVILAEDKAKVDARIGYVAENSGRGDIILDVLHIAPETESLVESRGLVFTGSQLAMRGTARVYETAKNSSTKVEVHTITLDDTAKGYSIPMLEIFTGNVREASHSASVTSIDKERIFYLKSRGLSWNDIKVLMKKSVLELSGAFEKINTYIADLV